MKRYIFFISAMIAAFPFYTYADSVNPSIRCETINSSSVGKEVLETFQFGSYINSTGAVCVARLNDCSDLTACVGRPIPTDGGIVLYIKDDSRGRYCAILKSGSTPVTVCSNSFGQD